MDLRIQQSTVGRQPVMSVTGELDLSTMPQLHSALYRFVQDHAGTRILVDIDGVTACDDAGLGVLLGATRRSRESGGDLIVVSSAGPLRTRLARTGFDRAVDVVASINDSAPG